MAPDMATFLCVLRDSKTNVSDQTPWYRPEAEAAAAAVAGALAEAPPLIQGCVEELVGAPDVVRRRVWASPGFLHARGSALTAVPSSKARMRGRAILATTPVMTHVFEVPVIGAAGGSLQLRVMTALFPSAVAPVEELLELIFGPDVPVALRSETESVFSDVSVVGGGSLDAAALAALPKQAHAALRVALKTQRLSGLAACIEARWDAGFLVMSHAVCSLRPQLAVPLTALQSALIVAHSGGAGALTSEVVLARQYHAEALETEGRYMEAAALYKQNISDDARNPALKLLAYSCAPQQWSFYGLALKRAGRYAEAHRAYKAGLRALSGPVEPDTPEWRETWRLDLLEKCITLADAWDNQELMNSAYVDIFEPQIELLKAQDDALVIFLGAANGVGAQMISRRYGRQFEVVNRTAGPADGEENEDLELKSVVELARDTNIDESVRKMTAFTPGSASERAFWDRKNARNTVADNGAAAAPAPLPPKRCALCGQPAYGGCSACGGPAYCNAACQKAHWKTHKPACKAACKAKAAA